MLPRGPRVLLVIAASQLVEIAIDAPRATRPTGTQVYAISRVGVAASAGCFLEFVHVDGLEAAGRPDKARATLRRARDRLLRRNLKS